MSTIKVNSIKNTATNDGGIAIDNSGHVQIDGQQLPSAGPLSNRNLVINGAMQVAQRGTSKTGLTNGDGGYHTVDRFRFGEHGAPTYQFTMTQSTDAPEGFRYSMRFDTTTAQATLVTDDSAYMETKLEGRDLGRTKYGTSNAEDITLSFYVKGSVPGTYVIWFYNPSGADSACTQTYTINSADTWEYKQITVAGDTALAISDTVNAGMHIRWILAAGPDYTSGTTSTTWTNNSVTNANRYGGQTVNLAASTNNDWQITGVQLEVGSVATPFEHRSYGDELARCQRYYTKAYFRTRLALSNTTLAEFPIYFKQSMRANPDLSATADLGTVSAISESGFGTEGCYLDFSNHQSSNYAAYWEASAEI
jgi:hypothetical protein|tara:strand:+ start:372 stop:1466 length:1095 start_codon:yes stop_codon:yes gene_type:complete